MKNKRIIYVIIAVIVVVGVIVGYTIYNEKDSKTSTISLAKNEIANMKETTMELPEFTISVLGSYDGTITSADLETKNVQLYEFDAAVDNGWEIVTNHYVGARLKDVLNAMQIENYSEVKFTSGWYLDVTYKKEEITDKTFLVFTRDGKPIRDDEKVNLLSLDFIYRYSLENLFSMYFTTEGINDNNTLYNKGEDEDSTTTPDEEGDTTTSDDNLNE